MMKPWILFGALALSAAAHGACDSRLTAAVLDNLSQRRPREFHAQFPEHLLKRMLPDVVLQVTAPDAVSQLRFRLIRTFGFGRPRALRLEAYKNYRRVYAWEFRHLEHREYFGLDVTPLDAGWLTELQAKSYLAAERVQVFLKYSPAGVIETVTIAPGQTEAARFDVSYPHD